MSSWWTHSSGTGAATGMKKHLQVGYRLSNKLLLQVSPNYLHPWQSYSSTQGLRINVYCQIKFSMAIEFLSVFTTSQASNQLVIVSEVGKYRSEPNTLPFSYGVLRGKYLYSRVGSKYPFQPYTPQLTLPYTQ